MSRRRGQRPPRQVPALPPSRGYVVLIATVAVLLSGGLGAVISSRSAPPDPAEHRPPCLRLGIPAYFDPNATDHWSTVTAAGSSVAYVIMNPMNGPGASRRPGYVTAVDAARDAGQTVLGYIPTDNGSRPLHEVRADAARYREWYGVRHVFFDEVPHEPSAIPTYRAYTEVVRDRGGTVVLNPGTVPARGYFDIADIIVTFEDTARAHLQAPDPPRWLTRIRRDRIWHLVIATPGNRLHETMSRAYARHAGLVYVTDDELPNPWNRLPTYWEREVRPHPPGCRPTSDTPPTAAR